MTTLQSYITSKKINQFYAVGGLKTCFDLSTSMANEKTSLWKNNNIRQMPSSSNKLFNKSAILILVAFVFIALLPQVNSSDLAYRICEFVKFQKNCTKTLQEDAASLSKNTTYCEGDYSSFVCWSHSEPGRIFSPCWSFSDSALTTKIASRYCQEDGKWYITEENKIWEHLEECKQYTTPRNRSKEEKIAYDVSQHFFVVYIVGCSISLLCLFVAIVIFAYFNKLHCTRNYIHLNLMNSFILRYAINLIKDEVIAATHRRSAQMQDATTEQLFEFCEEYDRGMFMTKCRIAVLLTHYAIISNYFWLLVEGLYLQMLLSLFRDIEVRCFKVFMVFGWGGPWLFVGLWAYLRASLDNTGCWQTQNSNIQWALDGPVLVTIIINFIIFINIIRIIVSKLQHHCMTRNDDKIRLAKSTLALIPLLGIYYIVFFVFSEERIKINIIASYTIDGIQLFFVSIQGTLVAVFYCFMNGEVKSVLRKRWKLRKWKNSLPRGQSRSRAESMVYNQNGNSHTSGTYVSCKRSAEDKDIELHSLSPYICNENSTSDYLTESNGNLKRNNGSKPSSLTVPDLESGEISTTSLLSNSSNV